MGPIASWFSLGGRFPALAVFGLPALTVALALVFLWGLRPWEDSADAPHEVPLGIEMAVGDGRALPATSTARVGAGVALPARPGVQTARRASGDAGRGKSHAPKSDGSSATVVIAPARAIAVADEPSSPSPGSLESGRGEEVPTVGPTAGVAPPEGTSPPVATPAGSGGGPQGPVAAGGKPPLLESCVGSEYLITVTFLDEESTVEEATVEIVLERLNEDGTTDELELEGGLDDVRALAATLEAEGNCVKVVIAGPEGEEGAEETPESGEEVVEPGESPVPATP